MKKDHLESVALAVEYIEEHLKEPLSVQTVCGMIELSPWQFQRIFRLVTGDSIGNYIRGRRLSGAFQELVKDPELKILSLAIEYQFGSQEAFTRAFKDMYRMTPGEVRGSQDAKSSAVKPKLNREKILKLHFDILKEPEIVNKEAKKFIGLPIEVKSPFGNETTSDKLILEHWQNFNSIREHIPHRVQGSSYGIIVSSDKEMNVGNLTYVAATEVTEIGEVTSEKMAIETTAQTYAAFQIKGYPTNCLITTDYIYGIWLPQSGFERAEGHDFEYFDHRKFSHGPESVSWYLVPVIKK